MQALEMEEVESLVGARNSRKNRGDDKQSQGMKTSVLTKRNMILVAVLLGLMIMIFAGGGGSPPDESDNDFSDGVAATSNDDDSTVGGGEQGDSSGGGGGDSPSPPSPVASPVAPDPVPAPVPAPVAAPVPAPTKPSSTSDVEYTYSKMATIVPLVDAHPPPDDKTKTELAEKYGHWGFWDGDEDTRPTDDYCGNYPNRDIPGDEFPDDAWQGDAVFVNHYLNDADKLISRSMEAIFTEYGHAKPLDSVKLAERMKMFHWDKIDLSGPGPFSPPEKYQRRGSRDTGGWTTKKSFDGLVRRLLHAMMTSDTFTVVMGGHSAAAGQGNHFRQSYMMQFHKTMYPIFARLGVKLVTRNMAQGGLGTIQAGMGSGSIYGDEVDLLLWDSGMTESGNQDHIDLYLRQGLIGGNRVPVLWGGDGGVFDALQTLYQHADADVGEFGNAMHGIEEVTSVEQAKTIPWAARYLKCSQDAQMLCDEEPRYCAKCWIDRDDGYKPETEQRETPRGQVKWHPGWRSHQLQGRALAFSVMEALQVAVNIWSEGVMGGPPLDEDLWHVTDYYENIRNKVKNLDETVGKCHNIKSQLPARMCNTPMKARTQYTPRANFHETSLSSIIKPTNDGYVPQNEVKALYNGPDVHNTCFDIPEGSIDVFDIISNRRHLKGLELSTTEPDLLGLPNSAKAGFNRSLAVVEPGKGWQVFDEPQGICDGTYNEVCGRQTDNECVLYGIHDGRGAVIGNEFAGWLVMNLKDLKAGIIVVKLHTWHYDSENTRTTGWTTVNNENQGRRLGGGHKDDKYEMASEFDGSQGYYEIDESGERVLMRSYETPDLPEEFIFEYAIDGEITSLSKSEFLSKKQQIQRVVETVTLLDDPTFTSEPKDVEVAIRLRGCGRKCTFGVSHIYWS